MISWFKRFFRPGKDFEGETETLHSFPINRYDNVTNNRFTVSFPDEFDIPAWLVRSAEIPVLTIDGDGCRFRIVLTDLAVIDTDGSVHWYDIRRKIASVLKNRTKFDLKYEFYTSCGKVIDSLVFDGCTIVELAEGTLNYEDDSLHEFTITVSRKP